MAVKKIDDKKAEQVVQWRRDLHQIPELGNDLPQTYAYVTGKLDEMGVKYEGGVGVPHGIVAVIEGNRPGKVVALRADMDALPVVENTGLPFQSTNGNMHACAHDAHTATMLGVVKEFVDLNGDFPGTVKFLFQPAEEISSGAEPMVQAGCLKNPEVDYVLGMHVGNISDEVPVGNFMFSTGPMMACLDRFTIKVTGKGSHGAYPHDSHDTLVASCYLVTALQEIVSREIMPTEPAVLTIGKLHCGSTYNVIPGEAEIEGTARSVNQETREYIVKRIGEIAEGITKSFRCSVEFDYTYGAPPLVNHEETALKAMASAAKVVGDDRVQLQKKPVMGGEDYAYYLLEKPGAFIFFSNPLEIDGFCYPHHNAKFAIDDSILRDGVDVFVQMALDLLGE